MVDLFSLAGVQDTARVMAGKLPASVAVLNDLDETGVVANIGAAEAVLKAIGMPLAPTQIYHRPAYTAAIAKGLSVTELGAKQQAAADAIRELWACPPAGASASAKSSATAPAASVATAATSGKAFSWSKDQERACERDGNSTVHGYLHVKGGPKVRRPIG